MTIKAGRAPDYRDRDFGHRKQSDIPKAEREEMEQWRRGRTQSLAKPSAHSRYDELKSFIGRWVSERLRIAAALKEIHDLKLYKHEYSSFADFCHNEYGINRSSAYRLIEFVEMKALTETSQSGTSISNETQGAELAKALPEERVQVLKEASKDGPPTARKIAEVIERRKPKPKVIDVEPEKPVRHCETCTCD